MRFSDIISLLREVGPRWLAWRLWYEAQLRWGFVRTLPPLRDVDTPLSKALGISAANLNQHLNNAWGQQGGSFPITGAHIKGLPYFISDTEAVIAKAERVLAGEFPFFSSTWRKLGSPPDWFQGAEEGSQWRSDVHWSRLPDLSPELGDIKYVWEPSRFGVVFTLARAWAATADERYPEAFWTLTEHWLRANRPEMGPHWRCGQEMSFRIMAWIFGLYTFRDCRSTTPPRVAQLIKNIWYHAYHVEKVHWYSAQCVRNNHAISEAAGLFTVGTLFPFLPGAERWRRKGAEFLAHELGWQVYEDGAYIQHSMNYARLVVQLCTWVLRLAHVNNVQLSPMIRDAAKRLLQFLTALQDPISGRLPNYGSNDGALLFPLSSCDYLDYRPALGALSIALGEGKLYDSGPWDEEAAWLCGPESLGANAMKPIDAHGFAGGTAFLTGGYYSLRGWQTQAMVRCATYRHRPAQADMLHLDVWYHGQNVLIDPGTYSYNAKPPWSAYFTGTASHNTITVNHRDQMRKGARFLWMNWTKSRLRSFSSCGGRVVFDGEHTAYAPIVHRRRVLLDHDLYVVLDELTGGVEEHMYRLHWLVNDFPLQLKPDGAIIMVPGHVDRPLRLTVLLHKDERVNWARASEDGGPRGWQSLYYGVKSPAWSMELVRKGLTESFITLIGPKERVDSLLHSGLESVVHDLKASSN